MSATTSNKSTPHKTAGKTLVVTVRDALRAQIESGTYQPGNRLPSEAQLTREFDVSRTVVREAIAALRADRLVEPRQGAGIFVLDPPQSHDLPFQNIDFVRISSMIELLELRTAVEVEAAALAATRRSPSQEENIIDCYRDLGNLAKAGAPTSQADFALHLAIADATNNPRFREFLSMIGPSVIPRRALNEGTNERASQTYLKVIDAEHEQIVAAILEGNEAAARDAMRHHLKGSQSRYRALLRGSNTPG
ncbi:FadR/GntR family transcriptional regulator [Aquimixticola soesokkakensis]|uniref:FadR/GntR family transcriptional regulator n=1 Tax=Aquimixticola soesokkakensis TaxID=1519096 RepID=UPI001F28A4AE|nr:FadR/GntR family transcriptional regulator [Aquimixticola soesokkakensis]